MRYVDRKNSVKLRTVAASTSLFLLAAIIFLAFIVYGVGFENRVSRVAVRLLPFPAIVLDWKNFVTVGELQQNLDSIRQFYANQDYSKTSLRVDFTTPEGKKRFKIKEKDALNKMIEDRAIQAIADRLGIKITMAMVEDNVSRKMDEYGDEDLRSNLQKLYGWDIEDFKDKLVRPSMYKEELNKYFLAHDDSGVAAKQKIGQAKAALDAGKSFEEVEKQFSEGITGDLGWFEKSQLVPEISQAIFNLDSGRPSQILESRLGFHIVEIIGRKKQGNKEMISLRQVFVKKRLFPEWLDEEMKKMRIYVPLREYHWDHQTGQAEFDRTELRDFEKEMIDSFLRDPNLII